MSDTSATRTGSGADSAALLESGARPLLGRPLEPARREALLAYLELLAHWNRAYNLTAITDPAEMVTRHLLDSLAVLPHVGDGRLLDAGTGAGLPGVPVAVMRPDLHVTLLDSAGKKIRFLRHVARQLGLDNIEPVQCRLETYRPETAPDTIVSRAFASLADFAASAQAVLAPGGRLVAMKGRRPEDELEALPDGVRVERIVPLDVPGLKEDRHVVIMSLHP